MRHALPSLSLLLALMVGLVGSPLLAEQLPDGLYQIRLHEALRRDSRQPAADCVIELERRDGRWSPECFAYAPAFIKGEHLGQVVEAEGDAREGAMLLRIDLVDDPWVEGGALELRLLYSAAEEARQWTYVGKFKERSIHGLATSRGYDLLPPLREVLQFQPGQHPRLLFDHTGIEHLRRSAATRQGQDILKRLRRLLEEPTVWHLHEANAGAQAAGHGLLYALTGAAEDARQAQELVWVRIRKAVGGPPLTTEAGEVIGVALAYDLCFDAWKPSFRADVTTWLEDKAAALASGQSILTKVDPANPWNAVCRSAAAIAALAILDDQGRGPNRPEQPQVHSLQPDDDYRVPDGLGDHWRNDELIRHWLIAGPFISTIDEDVLGELGGSKAARPQAGTSFAYGGKQAIFRVLDKRYIDSGPHSQGQPYVDLLAPIEREYHTTSVYAAAVRFSEPQLVRFRLGASHAVACRIFIGETEITDGDFLRVQAGPYPLLLRVEVGATASWGVIWMRPRFELAESRDLFAAEQASDAAMLAWERELRDWRAAGRTVRSAEASLQQALRHLRRFVFQGLGETGWMAEGDAAQLRAGGALLPFLHCWRQVTAGEVPLTTDPGLRQLLPNLALRLSRIDGQPALPGFGRGDAQLDSARLFRLGWSTLTESDQQLIDALLVAVLSEEASSAGLNDPLATCFAFLQQRPEKAKNTEKVLLPAHLVDHRQGWVLHRPPEVQSSPLIASLAIGNPRAGSLQANSFLGGFRLHGAGARWVTRGHSESGHNRVHIDGTRIGAAAELLGYHQLDTAIGKAEIDIGGGLRDKHGRPWQGSYRREWLVDHSGVGGAEVLIVIRDTVRPPPGKDHVDQRWHLQLGVNAKQEEDGSIGARPSKDTWLQLRCLQPGPNTMQLERGNRVDIAGTGDYLVVLACGRGEPPAWSPPAAGEEASLRFGYGQRHFEIRDGRLQVAR